MVLVREDDNRRGRPPGEVGELLRRGLVAAGFPSDHIAPDIYPEEQAVAKALDIARAGDLLVIFGDNLGRVWDQIVSFRGALPAGGGEGTAEAAVTAGRTATGAEAAAVGKVSSAGPPAAAAPAGGAGERRGRGPEKAGAPAPAAAQEAPARTAVGPALAARAVVAVPGAQAVAAETTPPIPSAPAWPPATRDRAQFGTAGRSGEGPNPRDEPTWPAPAATAEILPDDFDD